MKKTNLISAMLAALLAVSVTGCGKAQTTGGTSAVQKTQDTVSAQSSAEGEVVALSQNAASSEESGGLFTKRDLAQTADTSGAQAVTVSDGQTIDITDEGVYVLSGTAADCTVKVSADKNAKVQLVLDGVHVTNSDFPVIYVVSADKVFVTTTDSETAASARTTRSCRGA